MSEEALLQTIREDPDNAASVWLVLADWLEERGDARFELIRLRHDRQFRPELPPLARDDRVRHLLAAGVAPCVPTWTNVLGMKLVLIPAGTFTMGSPDSEADRFDDEGPQHEVEIMRPFYLGIYQVTQEQYKKVMGNNPAHFTRKNGGGGNHSVEQVSWEEAVEFCRKLSAQGKKKLLDGCTACRPRRSGNILVGEGPPLQSPSLSEILSLPPRPTSTATIPTAARPKDHILIAQARSVPTSPMLSACSTCTVTSMSGAPIGSMRTTTTRVLGKIRKARKARKMGAIVWCAAGRGASTASTAAPPAATGTIPATATTTSASGFCALPPGLRNL